MRGSSRRSGMWFLPRSLSWSGSLPCPSPWRSEGWCRLRLWCRFPALVFCGPVRLEQDGNCLYVRAIVSAFDLSLLIVLDSDARGGEILDSYGCRLLFHFSEKFLLCLCVLGFHS